jgi:hypothetical protein
VAFWQSSVAQAQEPVDLIVAQRWIVALDEWAKAIEVMRDDPLVSGSMGQLVLNPMAKWAASREAELHRLEQQLGIGLRHRSDLGVAVGNARLTAHDLIQRMQELAEGATDDDTSTEDEEDILAEFDEDG